MKHVFTSVSAVIVGLTVLTGLQGCGAPGLGAEVKTGLTAAGELCTFINYFLHNGVMATVCATAEEIAKFGKNGAAIVHARSLKATDAP